MSSLEPALSRARAKLEPKSSHDRTMVVSARVCGPSGFRTLPGWYGRTTLSFPLSGSLPGCVCYTDGPRIAIFTSAPVGDERLATISDLRRDDLRGLVAEYRRNPEFWRKENCGSACCRVRSSTKHWPRSPPSPAPTPEGWRPRAAACRRRGSSCLLRGIRFHLFAQPPHPVVSARLSGLLTDGHVVVVSVAGLDRGHAWWEIVPGSGDTRAVSPLGLHGGKIVYRWELRAHRGEFAGAGRYKQGTPSPKATVSDLGPTRGIAGAAEARARNLEAPERSRRQGAVPKLSGHEKSTACIDFNGLHAPARHRRRHQSRNRLHHVAGARTPVSVRSRIHSCRLSMGMAGLLGMRALARHRPISAGFGFLALMTILTGVSHRRGSVQEHPDPSLPRPHHRHRHQPARGRLRVNQDHRIDRQRRHHASLLRRAQDRRHAEKDQGPARHTDRRPEGVNALPPPLRPASRRPYSRRDRHRDINCRTSRR